MKQKISSIVSMFFLVIITSCDNNTSQQIQKFIDTDSVKFYKEFDVFQFKPITSLNNSTDSFPYVEIHYHNELINNIYMHTKLGVFPQAFEHTDSQLIRTRIYHPDPYFNYIVDFIKNERVLTYCYSCNDKIALGRSDLVYNSNCWLNSIQKSSKYLKYKYYFNDRDSIPSHSAMRIDTSHNCLVDLRQLISFSIDSIVEENEKIILIQTVFSNERIIENGRRFVFEYSKDSLYSVNWLH